MKFTPAGTLKAGEPYAIEFSERARRMHVDLVARQEHILREMIRRDLPRGLKWMADRPRALRALYAVLPSWRPIIQTSVDEFESRPGTFKVTRTIRKVRGRKR